MHDAGLHLQLLLLPTAAANAASAMRLTMQLVREDWRARWQRFIYALAVALAFGVVLTCQVEGQTVPYGDRITEYPIPPGGDEFRLIQPEGIASGPDGALWFTEDGGHRIGRITTAGAVTEYRKSAPGAIALGPDRAMWISGLRVGKIVRITTAGAISESQRLSDPVEGAAGIAAGPDGALWFTEPLAGVIGRMTTDGVVAKYYLEAISNEQAHGNPSGIVTGPDGALWFNDTASGAIGRITTAGAITRYALPTHPANMGGTSGWGVPIEAAAGPNIAVGPDGALWFTESGADRIGRITTAGAITEFSVRPPPPTLDNPIPVSGPQGIAAGRDGALWFTQSGADKIGRITTAGAITDFQLPRVPGRRAKPMGITAGPDGAMWFTEEGTWKIGRIAP